MEKSSKDVEVLLGNPKKSILYMSVPLFFSFLIGTLQNFIDGVWCSGLGPDQLSAISIGGPAYQIIMAIGMAMGVGSTASIARAIGAGNKTKAERLASQSVIVTVIASFFVMFIMFFCTEPLVRVSGGGYNVDITMEYMRPYLFCTLPLVSYGLITGLLRAEGAAKKSTVVSISASIINMILDPIMIYVLDLGVAGAAWATCISFIFALFLGISFYAKGETYLAPPFKGFRFDPVLLKEIGVVAIPYAIEIVLMSLMVAPEQYLVTTCGGSDGLVVYVNAFKYVALVMIPSTAIGAALIPVISAQIGQEDSDKVNSSIIYSAKVIFLIEAILGVILFIFAEQLINLYTYSEGMAPLHDEMVLALRIYSVVPVTNGMMRIGISVLQAMRKAVVSSALSFMREIFFLSFYWVASRISMEAIYWSLDLTNILAMTIILFVSFHYLKKLMGENKETDGSKDSL